MVSQSITVEAIKKIQDGYHLYFCVVMLTFNNFFNTDVTKFKSGLNTSYLLYLLF